MDDVEVVEAVEHLLEHTEVRREGIDGVRIEPQGARTGGDQPGRGLGVTAGEQGNVLALSNELLRQERDDALGAAIQNRRDTFIQRRHLSDAKSHEYLACLTNKISATPQMPRTFAAMIIRWTSDVP
jgi:hypothetical protein